MMISAQQARGGSEVLADLRCAESNRRDGGRGKDRFERDSREQRSDQLRHDVIRTAHHGHPPSSHQTEDQRWVVHTARDVPGRGNHDADGKPVRECYGDQILTAGGHDRAGPDEDQRKGPDHFDKRIAVPVAFHIAAHSTPVLPSREANVHRLDVGEVTAGDDALFDQSLEDSATAAWSDAELRGERQDRLADPARAVQELADAPLVRCQVLLGGDRPNPQQIHSKSSSRLHSRR